MFSRRRSFLWITIFILIVSSGLSIQPNVSAVASDCTVDEFSVNPNAPIQQTGTILSLYGRGHCAGGIRASRFNIDGGGFGEDAGAPEQNETWALTSGMHAICFEISGGSDGSWGAGAQSCTTITGQDVVLTPTTPPPTSTPGSSSCRIEFFTAIPASPVLINTWVNLHGKGTCDGGVRAVKFQIDGIDKAEIGQPEQTETWKTNESGLGVHSVCFLVAGGTNASWDAGAKECKTYEVVTVIGPTNPPPPPPTGIPSTGIPSTSVPIPTQANCRYTPAYGTVSTPDEDYVYVPSNITCLRLRAGAGDNYQIKGYVIARNYYVLLGVRGSWANISTSIGDGWVDAAYVQIHYISKPTQTLRPSLTPTRPSSVQVAPHALNICNPRCWIEDGNWVEFYLPKNGYDDLRLHSKLSPIWTVGTSFYPCTPFEISKDTVCVRAGISHKLLYAMIDLRRDWSMLALLRNANNWYATYKPR